MTLLATLFLELAAVIAAVLVCQFVVLLFRDPHRHAILRIDATQTLAAVALVALACLAVGSLIAGLVDAGVNVFATLGVAAALPLVTAFAGERAFRIRERLRRADAGESPFHLPGRDALRVPTAPQG